MERQMRIMCGSDVAITAKVAAENRRAQAES